jgi:hypothetical protein
LIDERHAASTRDTDGGPRYATSLPRPILMAMSTGRAWNRLHRAKDVALGEDASLVHTGHGPTVLAMLRDTALSLLHRAGGRRIAAQLRYHSQYPHVAAALLLEPFTTRA